MTDAAAAPAPSTRRKALIAIGLAIGGAALMFWGFAAGIDAALNGAGNGAGIFVVIFFLGAAAVILALVLAVMGLVRRNAVGLSAVALVIALLPVIGVIVLFVRARG